LEGRWSAGAHAAFITPTKGTAMHNDDARVDELGTLPMFRNCTPRQLRVLAGVLTPVSVEPGRVLCREGEIGRESFVIVTGEADVSIDGISIAALGAGSFCGEMAVLDGDRRCATVTARTPMTLYSVDARALRSLATEIPTVAVRLASVLSARLRIANRRERGRGELAGRTPAPRATRG